MGSAMFIQDALGKFNALETLQMLHDYPITTLCAPPTAYLMLVLEEPMTYLKANPPKALRHCVGAGEPLNPEVIRAWEENTGMIIAGYRIGPFEVESALKEHPAVAESAVVASPDEMRGEIVKAFVILAPGYSPSPELADELQAHVKKVTAPYKYPREIEFVESLPKTISGKIRRVELREHERQKKLGQ